MGAVYFIVFEERTTILMLYFQLISISNIHELVFCTNCKEWKWPDSTKLRHQLWGEHELNTMY
uniref:Uncharacterized protein n=1 Tax=Onchocerca volvulus TaxID=6282 RepID=A0A8R1XWQ3_ONCVO